MKMLIDKIKLKYLLEQKRDYIKRSIDGIDIVITALLYIVSLLCSDFKTVLGIDARVIQTLSWVVAVVLLCYGFCQIYRSIRYKYNHIQLYQDIENLNEVVHRFSIVTVKDEYKEFPNRFLLYYDQSWKCWFFFSFATSEYDNEDNIIQRLSNKLKIDSKYIKVRYITDRLQPKFSEKDQIHKVYQHSLYQAVIAKFPKEMQQSTFKLEGTQFKWWTIEEMELDEEIMKKNADVVAFVKEKIA